MKRIPKLVAHVAHDVLERRRPSVRGLRLQLRRQRPSLGAALTLVRHGVLAEAGEEGTLGTVALAGCEAGDNRRHQHPQRPLYHTPARMQAVRAGRAVAHASHSHWHKHATTTTQVPTPKANPTNP